jgi:hypothetical protein
MKLDSSPLIDLLLWITLIIFKIIGVIEIGWFWVITGFIWIPLLISISFFIMLIIIAIIVKPFIH